MGDQETNHGSGDDHLDAHPFQFGRGSTPPVPAMNKSGVKTISSAEFYSDTYKMDYPQRGKALIFNNRHFHKKLQLGERVGTDQDASALYTRFTEMGFDVEPHQDVTVQQMRDTLRAAAKDDDFNSESDCFVCAILSHGEEGVVFGIDDKVEVKQLMEPFKGNNCPSLIGKPKIFFIQACQGSQFDAGVNLNVADAKGFRGGDEIITVHKIPSEADFLIAYSVVPGYFSWRNSANGSWFVQALSEILYRHWKDLDLLTMMTRVNKKVAYEFESRTGKEFMNQKKQIPCITSMLTKEVRFKPKE